MESRSHNFHRSSPARESREFSAARRQSNARIPSTSGYMVAASATAGALFFLLWWMLQGEENPWIPAGLAASVVMLVAVAARAAVIRRAWTRYTLEHDGFERHGDRHASYSSSRSRSRGLNSDSWRALQRHAAEVDAGDSLPEAHREIYQLCADYLASTDEALRTPDLSTENRLALRASQDRAHALQRRHLLRWARDSARSLTREAQQHFRLHEKIEIANRALECIDSALRLYPDEQELNQSAVAVREFITSSRVAHWVELAERAAFKGHHRRAIDCYRDALFYLTRDGIGHADEATAERIGREIELLRARLVTMGVDTSSGRKPDQT